MHHFRSNVAAEGNVGAGGVSVKFGMDTVEEGNPLKVQIRFMQTRR